MNFNNIFLLGLILIAGCYSDKEGINTKTLEPFKEKKYLWNEPLVASQVASKCYKLSELIDVYIDSDVKIQKETLNEILKIKNGLLLIDGQINISIKNFKGEKRIIFLNKLKDKIRLLLIDIEEVRDSINNNNKLKEYSIKIDKTGRQIELEVDNLYEEELKETKRNAMSKE